MVHAQRNCESKLPNILKKESFSSQSLTSCSLPAGRCQSFPGAADLPVQRSSRPLSGERRPGPVSGGSGEWTLVSSSWFRCSAWSRSAGSRSSLPLSPQFGWSKISGEVCLNLSDQTQLCCRIKVREHKFATLSKHLTRQGKDRMCDAGIFIKGWHIHSVLWIDNNCRASPLFPLSLVGGVFFLFF